jgi:hypothetical protein
VDAIIHAFDEDGDRELCQIEIRALQVPSNVCCQPEVDQLDCCLCAVS